MKNNSFNACVFLVLILSLSLASCSKEEGSVGWEAKPKVRLVDKIVMDFGNNKTVTTAYSYDRDGRPTKVIRSSAGYGEDYTQEHIYTLTGNSLVIDCIDRSKYNYDLDVNNRAISWIDWYDRVYKFTYIEGYLTEFPSLSGDNYILTWEGENLVKTSSMGIAEFFTYYDYENKMNINMFDFYYSIQPFGIFGMFSSGYFGKCSKNLLHRMVYYDLHEQHRIEYTYEFDQSGYVTGFTLTQKDWDGTKSKGIGTITYIEQ